MATLLFSGLGASLGSGLFGPFLGAGIGAMLGRAGGALFGRAIDARLFGTGHEPITPMSLEKLYLQTAQEGAPLKQVYGRARIAGNVIWASEFTEHLLDAGSSSKFGESDGTYPVYTVSLAIALCEGKVNRIGRVWADNLEISFDSDILRFYEGNDSQMPDPAIVAVEGIENAPAFRGVSYVVLENIDLARFGNRVPQFQFEVFRRPEASEEHFDPADRISAVSIIPSTGEYSLATSAVTLGNDAGAQTIANLNVSAKKTDFVHSIEQLKADLPNTTAASLVVSWFGDDLRCGQCKVQPKVENSAPEGDMIWRVSGVTRETAELVSRKDDRPVYGGTPSDQSVIESIQHLKSKNIEVMFYPFILMDIPIDNQLPSPYSGGFQGENPWRGRITLDKAPGEFGSTDRTEDARLAVNTYLGSATADDFLIQDGHVHYTGDSNDFGYRRFILHYAHLCKLAGGVDQFLVGSELRGLTQIRDENDDFPFVEALNQLVNEVRLILGESCEISYAADWSEYFGYQPPGENTRYFHLDSIWGNPNTDFVGIDNYMPLSDWRHSAPNIDGEEYGSVYNLTYLLENIAGGEGYDWYYQSHEARNQQQRSPIFDGLEGEDWIYRYKDLVNWWGQQHFDRIDGIKSAIATDWQPQSKPIRFTEYGCAAIDLGTNQPNVFLDKNSSENAKPYFSTGDADTFMQMQYLRAMLTYWSRPENNPISTIYNGQMLDTARAYAWTWDARPWPNFPQMLEIWSDGENYKTGHWLSGRVLSPSLAAVVREICLQAGFQAVDVTKLYGVVNGIAFGAHESPKNKLDVLAKIYGFTARFHNGVLVFESMPAQTVSQISKDHIVWDGEAQIETTIEGGSSVLDSIEVKFISSEDDYELAVESVYRTGSSGLKKTRVEFPAILSRNDAKDLGLSLLKASDARRISRNVTLPLAYLHLKCGDLVSFDDEDIIWHVNSIEISNVLKLEVEQVYFSKDNRLGNALDIGLASPPNFSNYWVEILPLPRGESAQSSHAIAISKANWEKASLAISRDDETILPVSAKTASTMGAVVAPLASAQSGFVQSQSLHVKFQTAFTQGLVSDVYSTQKLLAIELESGWEYLGFHSVTEITPNEVFFHGVTRCLYDDKTLCAEIDAGAKVVYLGGALYPIDLEHTRSIDVAPSANPSFVTTLNTLGEIPRQKKALTLCQFHAKRVLQTVELSWRIRDISDDDHWAIANLGIGFHAHLILYRDGDMVQEHTLSQANFLYPQSENFDEVAIALITPENQISDYERFVINDYL